jgi:hypothetical protein
MIGSSNTAASVLSHGRFTGYHRIGWCPIPLKPREKIPTGAWKSYQSQRPSGAQCGNWDNAENNIGIVTGDISDIFVLDVDGAQGEATLQALIQKHGELPETPLTHTGKGRHFYFRYPAGVEIRNLSGTSSSGFSLPGIDVRGAGGYVVAPPSIHPNGSAYRWEVSPWDVEPADAPDWLLGLVTAQPEAMLPAAQAGHKPEAYLEAALQGELTALATSSNGSRNDALNKAAFALGQLIPLGLAESSVRSRLEAVALAIGLSSEEIRLTIDSGLAAGMASPRTDKTDTTNVSSVMSGEDWPKPQPVKQALLPVPALDPAIIPEPLRAWLVDVSQRMQCPLDYVAVSAVASLGALIGARCSIRPKRHDPDWCIIPNLWGIVVGKPSTLKSPAMDEATRIIKQLEKQSMEQYAKEKQAYELAQIAQESKQDVIKKQIAELAKGKSTDGKTLEDFQGEYAEIEAPEVPTWRRYHTNDTTVEKLSEMLATNPQGLLVFRDELIAVLLSWEKEGRTGDRAFFLEGWNGFGSHITDRIGRGTVVTENVCISILGGTQPSRLNYYLNRTLREVGNDGLIQRFQLLVYPDDIKQWKLEVRGANLFARDRVNAIFTTIDGMCLGDFAAGIGKKKLPYFRFEDEAQSLFYEWLTRLEIEKLRGGEEGLIIEHLAKYRKLMPALALIFHIVRLADGTANGQVSREATEQAIAWCDYLEQHARRIYHMVADAAQQAAAALCKRIRQGELEDGFTVRSIYRKGWHMLTDQELVEIACEELVRLGWIREYAQPTTQRGGRPKVSYIINPSVSKTKLADTDITDET